MPNAHTNTTKNTPTTRQAIVSTSQRMPIRERPEWLDARGARSTFYLCRSTLYRLADEGKIRTTSLRERGQKRGKRLFSYDSIAAFLESRATGGEATPEA